MNDNTNFMLAIVLSVLILMGFHYFYEAPRAKALQARAQATEIMQKELPKVVAPAAAKDRAELIKETKRITINNGRIHGSINLKGGRFDDLTLANYRQTTDLASAEIVLLSPSGSKEPALPYYAEFGWLAADKTIKLPDADTEWTADKTSLNAGNSVTLTWDNGSGLVFERMIALDENFMFSVTQRVKNNGKADVSLFPFGLISRHGSPKNNTGSIVHEGPLGVLDGTLREHNYKKLGEEGLITQESTGGWLGITDVYWLVSLLADREEKITARFLHSKVADKELYQVDMQGEALVAKAGESISQTRHLFAGAKEVDLLDGYEKSLGAPMFDKAIDFGWFYVFAKPFFHTLDFLYKQLGNYGLAIIVFTILIRLLFYPMQEGMYRNMAAMKELQPEITRLKEQFSNDPLKMNEEMTKLYKKEKLNPLAGCLPIFVQIPIFFALYKVLLVSIEMRHAPFYGWVTDLSAADPSNVFTLFGLIPWSGLIDLGFFKITLHLGAWPILMGLTMYIQQKLSPPPADKTTAQVFMFLPFIFTFLLATMSAGLVIYWTLSNVLAIAQQTLIKHRAKTKEKA